MKKKCIFFKDPIHNLISFYEGDQWLLELINTPEFQRLNRIQQLGGSSSIFPTATHSRLTHSLGTYEMARRILKHVEIEGIDEYQRKVILAVALLHDIGHGPHSHAFEWYTNFQHEAMTVEIMTNPKSTINQVLIKNKINPQDLADVMLKKTKHKWMIDLISSEIDADRIDYLLRDSHFTGASYGVIDCNILFKWMMCRDGEIIFSKKAVHVIENILFARYYMYLQIYEHHYSIGYEWLIKQVMLRVKDLYQAKYQFKDQFNLLGHFSSWLNNKTWEVTEFVKLNDDIFNTFLISLQYEEDPILKDLISNHLNQNNFRVVEYDAALKAKLLKACKAKKLDSKYYLDEKLFKRNIYQTKQPIKIYDEDNDTICLLTDSSDLIQNNMKTKFERKLLFYNKNLLK